MYVETTHCYQQFTSTHLFVFLEFALFFTWETFLHNGPIYWTHGWPELSNLSVDQFYSKKQKLIRRCFIYLKQPRCVTVIHLCFISLNTVPDCFPFVSLTLRNWKERRKLQPEVGYYLCNMGLICHMSNKKIKGWNHVMFSNCQFVNEIYKFFRSGLVIYVMQKFWSKYVQRKFKQTEHCRG